MLRDAFYRRIDRETLARLAHERETPAFLYFAPLLRERIAELRETLPEGFQLLFAVKANPHADLLGLMAREGLGADVASGGELERALAAGIPAGRIEFSGPAKSNAELERAAAAGLAAINIESLGEIERIATIARRRRQPVAVGLRLNTGGLEGAKAGLAMAGATPFGLAPEVLPEALRRIEQAGEQVLLFRGIHAHSGSQILDADAIVANFRRILDLGLAVLEHSGRPPGKINFGGGWGVPYFDRESPLDLEELGDDLADLLDEKRYAPLCETTRFKLEPGRFLAAEAGCYLTTVRDVKVVGDTHFAITDGGMHHAYVLAGGMGQVIRRNFQWDCLPAPGPRPGTLRAERWQASGCLCTPQDLLLRDAPGPPKGIAPGDRLVFFNLGAYGPSASPGGFLSHAPAAEELLETLPANAKGKT